MSDEHEPPVGSPAWLELQRQKERGEQGALTKAPSAGMELVGGIVLTAMGLAFNVLLADDDGRDSLFRLTPSGFVLFRLAPVVLGLFLIVDGLRRRRAGS